MQLKETSGEQTDISNGDNNHEYRDKSQVSITHSEDASSQTECSESNAEKINTPNSGSTANGECTGETCLRTASYASATKEKNSQNQFADRPLNGNLSDTCCSKNEQKNSNERSCDIYSRKKSNRKNVDATKSYADAIKSDKDYDKNILNVNGKNSVEQENRYSFSEAQKDNKNCNMKISTISNGKTAEEEHTKNIPHRKFDYETRNNIRNKRMLAPLAECPTEKSESKNSASNNLIKNKDTIVSNGTTTDKVHKRVDPKRLGAIPKVRHIKQNKSKNKNSFLEANTNKQVEAIDDATNNFEQSTNKLEINNFGENNSKEIREVQSLENRNLETALPADDHFEHTASCHQEEFTDLNIPNTTNNVKVESTFCDQINDTSNLVRSSENCNDANSNFVYSYSYRPYINPFVYAYNPWAVVSAGTGIISSFSTSENVLGYSQTNFSDDRNSQINTFSVLSESQTSSKLSSSAPEFIPEKNKRNSNLDVDNNLVEMCEKSLKLSEKEKNSEGLTQSDSNCESNHLNENESQPQISSKEISDSSSPPNDEFEEETAYMFLLPFRLCGSLIGKNGQFLKYIHSKTNVVVNVGYESNTCDEKLITVVGKESKVQAALEIIKNQFKHFPTLTFAKLNDPYHCECPPQLIVQPPVNLDFEVVVTSVVSPTHFFVNFPTLPQYYHLQSLYYCMTNHYNTIPTPKLGTVKTRNIVVAPFHDNWLRAEVVNLLPDDKCEIKYLDMGGYNVVDKRDLRPVKAEFLQIPFQALECRLADVTCSEQSWTESSQNYFHSLVASQVLKAIVGYYDNNNIPHLYVYRIDHGTQIFINQAFVEAGLCIWSS